MRRLVPFLCLSSMVAFLGWSSAGPHPFHDDGGSVNWRANWKLAVDAARFTGKPIFLEGGREA